MPAPGRGLPSSEPPRPPPGAGGSQGAVGSQAGGAAPRPLTPRSFPPWGQSRDPPNHHGGTSVGRAGPAAHLLQLQPGRRAPRRGSSARRPGRGWELGLEVSAPRSPGPGAAQDRGQRRVYPLRSREPPGGGAQGRRPGSEPLLTVPSRPRTRRQAPPAPPGRGAIATAAVSATSWRGRPPGSRPFSLS